jgi:hypothetical protein
MLHGQYTAENAEFEEVQQFVDALERPAGIVDISSNYGADTFISGWRGLSEKTSSSPSGRYIGLYKALIDNYEDNEDTVLIFNTMSATQFEWASAPRDGPKLFRSCSARKKAISTSIAYG